MRRRLVAPLVMTLFAVLTTTLADAAITPEARAVVTRYVEASGGAQAFAAESTSYVHANVQAFGFTGTFASWAARPGKRYARTELGPFKLQEGSDGTTAWRTDPTTGVIRPLADHDLEDALTSTWFELERWAEPGEGGGTVTLAGHERDSLARYTVLEVTAPDPTGKGARPKPRRLWFRDADGLVVRTLTRDDQREVTSFLSGHEKRAGRMRAMVSETIVASMPANRLRTVSDTVLANVDVSGLPFTPPDDKAAADAVTWLAKPGVARLPFEYRARHVWLTASVNGGPPDHFLFDTGASVTVLDSAWASEHGIRTSGRMQAAGAGASGGATFATLDSLRIAAANGDGIALRDVKVAVLDVNPSFEPMFWRRMAGVIGYDVISRFVVTIDYDDSVLVLHDPDSYRYTGVERPLPMVMNGTVPALKGTLDGTDHGLFRLDVGSSSTVDVHTPFARAKGLRHRMGRTHEVDGVGFGGSFTMILGRLRGMSLGPYEWDDPIVSLSTSTEGAFASEEFAGNIGNRILERFRVTFDYQRRTVVLEPGRRYGDRDRLTRTGVLLTRVAGVVRVGSVLPASPAARAGLFEGDQVLSIDGRTVGDWDLPGVSALLDDGEAGRKVPMVVRRGDRDLKLHIRLAEVIR